MIFLSQNFLLKHVFEEKAEGSTEVTGRRKIRRMQLLDNLKESTGY